MFQSLFDPVFYGDFVSWQEVFDARRPKIKAKTRPWPSNVMEGLDDYDLSETDDSYIIRVDVPGVPVTAITATVKGSTVTVQVVDAVTDTTERSIQKTRRTRRGTYRFNFPDTASMETADVTVQDGVLTIRVAKRIEQERQLPLSTQDSPPAIKA